MKKEDLFDALGDVHNQYIKEAHMKNKRESNSPWMRWGSIAACFALLVLCIPIVAKLSPKENDVTPSVESSPIENGNNKEESMNTQESETLGEFLKEEASTEVSDTEPENTLADREGEKNDVVDSSILSKDISVFFGGSYTDANGQFVIVLTEDTPANRAAICRELHRSESNTSFVKGTYTLAYLTELQTKITDAMRNKELPFVTMSGVCETSNNIVVSVTTNDEAELAKLYAFDTLGGAIEVQNGSGASFE